MIKAENTHIHFCLKPIRVENRLTIWRQRDASNA